MHENSLRIVEERKAALSKGDDALLQEVGEGKDIMSVCRTSVYLCVPGPHNETDGVVCAVKANMAASARDRLSDHELLAHMS